MRLRIKPSKVSGTASAPPSKSYTHRALILGSLAQGETVIENFLDSDDTRYTIDACRSLGIKIQTNNNTVRITGSGGKFSMLPGKETIFVGNSGSSIRMVAPLAALAQTKVVFNGDTRLRQRPVGDLLSALKNLGVQVAAVDHDKFPPIELKGGNLLGGEIAVSGMTSSQHISALLMIGPYTERGVRIKITDQLRSKPYVDVTIDAMRHFGIDVENNNYKDFAVSGGQRYQGQHYNIEGDFSSAAYFFAMAAIGRGPVSVRNLKANSPQGDRYFLDILNRMGCSVHYSEGEIRVSRDRILTGLNLDMSDYPDIVPPLTAVATYATGNTKITNIGNLRYKETDRVNDTATELSKMGIRVEVTENTMSIDGGIPKGAVIETYNDHRMVMSFTTAALFADGDTIINGAEAVTKSYPSFFNDIAQIGASIEEIP